MNQQQETSYLHYIVHLNNEGAKAINARNTRVANHCLVEAFRTCKKQIAANQVAADATMMNTSEKQENIPQPNYSMNQYMSLESCPWTRNGDASTCSIYRQAIHIPESLPQDQDSTKFGLFLSIVVIFNLALAHQLGAEQLEEKNDQESSMSPTTMSTSTAHRRHLILRKAIFFYRRGYDLLRNLHNCSMSIDSELYVLATLNNLAQAHLALKEQEEAEICHQRILSLIPLYIYYGMNKNHAKEFGFFLASSLNKATRDTIPAAAA